MKLTVQVKLLPTREQSDALRETLRQSNAAANVISNIAWEHRKFGQYSGSGIPSTDEEFDTSVFGEAIGFESLFALDEGEIRRVSYGPTSS